MGFSEKAKRYFNEELKLTNRDIAKIMDDYNEILVGRYLNSDEISGTFLKKIQKYFPDADINYLISDDEISKVGEGKPEEYRLSPEDKIDKIITQLMDLKQELSQK